jgi:hypothetical protein
MSASSSPPKVAARLVGGVAPGRRQWRGPGKGRYTKSPGAEEAGRRAVGARLAEEHADPAEPVADASRDELGTVVRTNVLQPYLVASRTIASASAAASSRTFGFRRSSRAMARQQHTQDCSVSLRRISAVAAAN